MNTNRYESPRKPTLAASPLFQGVGPAFWSASLVVVLLLIWALYWLLTHPVPVVAVLPLS